MPHTIEVAKTGRAGCRTCKEPIAKGALRFGEEQKNLFGEGPSFAWHHLACAARKRPHQLAEALAAYPGEVPDRAAIEQTIAAEAPKQRLRPTSLPYAERAPTGRSHCIACHQPIEKGALRVAVEREVDGGYMNPAPSYLHAGCAPAHLAKQGDGDGQLLKLKDNSIGLDEAARGELDAALLANPS